MKRVLAIALAALLLCGCTAAPDGSGTTEPMTTAPIPNGLREGFYVPTDEETAGLMCYAELKSGGTGTMSILGMEREFEWTPEGFVFGEVTAMPTEDGFIFEDTVETVFVYTGDTLPEGILPDASAPGSYVISSVGVDGNMELFGAADPEENGLELNADGTAVLVYRGTAYPLTWDGCFAAFENGSRMLLADLGAAAPGEPALVMGYALDESCPIGAQSIAFRRMEDKEESK